MPQLPTGTVTFLFSDIEGSSHLWEQAPDLMAAASERHDQILRSATEATGGHVFKSVGDSLCAAFRVADQAVSAAVAAQRGLSAESWPGGAVVQVRISVHTGESIERDGDYFGPALKQVATLLSAAHGGQVLVSGETANLVSGQLPVGIALRSLGSHHGRGLERSEEVFQLDVDGLSPDFTSLRSEVGLFDVFVSYRRTDQAIVRLLVDSLKRRGLVVWFDETSIPDFGGITDSVRQGLAESKALLVFYSAEYPQSSPCQWELTAAFLASSRLGDPRRRVLVVNPEPGPGHIEPVELREALHLTIDGEGHGGIEQIADAVAVQVDRLHGELGAGILAPSLWLPTKPSAATRFVGRWREMWRIHSALHAPETATTQGAVGQGAVQVRGLGGIGKSLLAREYALRFEARYPGGVFWLYAQGDLTVESSRQERDALRLGQLRGFAASVLGAESAVGLDLLSPQDIEAVLRNSLASSEPCLWVVDDLPAGLAADEVYRWLGPTATTSTLITTRSGEYGALVHEVALSVLEPEEALEVLLARRKPADDEELAAAKAVVAELGGHALAIDVAGATLRFQSFAELLDRLSDLSSDELELAAELREELPTGRERSISSTLSHSLSRLDDDGQDLLRLASMLARDPIPRSLFDAVLASADGISQSAARRQTLRALDQAASLSLVAGVEPDSWQIHPLLARTVQLKEGDHARRDSLHRAVVCVLRESFADVTDPSARAEARQLVTHARRVVQVLTTVDEADLLGRVADYDYETGDYKTARLGHERQVATLIQLVGSRDPQTLRAKARLAATLRILGELEESRQLSEEVIEAASEVFGARHEDTLAAMGELARTLFDLGEMQTARTLSEEVVAGRREVLGPENVSTLLGMRTLAITLRALGDFRAAQALEEQVLSTFRSVLGPRNPQTLESMTNLAVTIRASGDPVAARKLDEEVLAGFRDVVGSRHPHTLLAMNNLAETLRVLGDFERARDLAQELVEASREVMGPEHLYTIASMDTLACILRELGEMQAASAMGEEAVAAFRQVLGAHHFVTLQVMNNQVETLRVAGELSASRESGGGDLGLVSRGARCQALADPHGDEQPRRYAQVAGRTAGSAEHRRGSFGVLPGGPRTASPRNARSHEQSRSDLLGVGQAR